MAVFDLGNSYFGGEKNTFKITTTGTFVPAVDDSYTIGSSDVYTVRPRNIYTAATSTSSQTTLFGTEQDDVIGEAAEMYCEYVDAGYSDEQAAYRTLTMMPFTLRQMIAEYFGWEWADVVYMNGTSYYNSYTYLSITISSHTLATAATHELDSPANPS